MTKAIYYESIDKAISKLISIEKAEEGYLEKASNKSLDSKTANAGYNNYTKYWRDLNDYGLMEQSSNFAGGSPWYWCAGFQTWCYIKAFGIELAKKILLHLPYISCATMGDKAKSAERLYGTPKKGDIVLFHNGSRFSHTGFVYKVEDGRFYTIEGNTNNGNGVVPNGGSVCLKSYSIKTYQAKGTKFFRPNYSVAVKKGSSTTVKAATESKAAAKSSTSEKKLTIKTKSGGNLNCREAANGNAKVVGKFANGSSVTLIKKENTNWYKVKGKDVNGKTVEGFCSSAYLV